MPQAKCYLDFLSPTFLYLSRNTNAILVNHTHHLIIHPQPNLISSAS